MKGRILNDRYKIIEKLGEGGMALVYKARDLLLGRWVAVKILRPQLVSDRDFVDRFKREARAVASLSHPNIVNIYDIGQYGDIHYLVMEMVEGDNLKSKIREGSLDIRESLEIAIQICRALETAHNKQIIHCDIKPHNILITGEGKVKVTDFGIARAVTSTTFTQTQSILGSAYYLSPELARGGKLHYSSDLYSLGVVLYEMVTGELPFSGDSPISVALKHIRELPEEPLDLNPSIPRELNDLILKALSKEPGDRFDSARMMRRRLEEVKSELEKEKLISEPDHTRKFPGISGSNAGNHDLEETKRWGNDNRQVLMKDDPGGNGEALGAYQMSDNGRQARNKAFKIAGTILLVLVLFFLGAWWAYMEYMDVPVVEVPKVVGLKKNEALEILKDNNLRMEVRDEKHSPRPEGEIIAQYPGPGERVRANRVVFITVSAGPAWTSVPKLVGESLWRVEVLLDEHELKKGEVTYSFSDEVDKNIVIQQNPAPGEKVIAGTPINLTISKGPRPPMISVPNLYGLTRTEAENIIKSKQLVVGEIKTKKTLRFLEGQVAGQTPAPGEEVAQGTPINLIISSGIINISGANIHAFWVRIKVPQGEYNQNIKIYIQDNNGRQQVYNAVHHPGDTINQKYYSVGPTIVQVYSNNKLLHEERLGF